LHIPIHVTRQLQPVAWSAGFCPSCRQTQVARIELLSEAIAVAGIAGRPNVVGRYFRCDFCQRLIPPANSRAVPMSAWDPARGRDKLFEMLELPREEWSMELTDASLHSLLDSTRESCGILRQPKLMGFAWGFVFGSAMGALSAINLDKGTFSLSCICAAVVGATVGAWIESELRRRKSARLLLQRAVDQYGIDTRRLMVVAEEHGALIRRAVSATHARAQFAI
jgi:hypothetical protein